MREERDREAQSDPSRSGPAGSGGGCESSSSGRLAGSGGWAGYTDSHSVLVLGRGGDGGGDGGDGVAGRLWPTPLSMSARAKRAGGSRRGGGSLPQDHGGLLPAAPAARSALDSDELLEALAGEAHAVLLGRGGSGGGGWGGWPRGRKIAPAPAPRGRSGGWGWNGKVL